MKCWNCDSTQVVRREDAINQHPNAGRGEFICDSCGAAGDLEDFGGTYYAKAAPGGLEQENPHGAGWAEPPMNVTGAKKEKTYLNILDQMLDHGVSDADMKDSRKRGDDLSDLTQSMAEDGSFTKSIRASSDAARTHIAQKLSDDNILNDVAITESEAKSNKDGLAHAANEKAVMSAIDTLLKRGVAPARIKAALEKCAELNLYNKQFSTDHLNRRIGELGMNYLQPNTFMPKAPDTYDRKRINASAHVAIEAETILGFGESKFGGEARVQRPAVEIKTADRVEGKRNASTIGLVPTQPTIRTAGDAVKTASVRNRGEDFDAGSIAEQHVAGKGFKQIWDEACKHAGLHLASKAFHEYVSRAKQKGVKFASSDVEFFSTKLGIKNVAVAITPKPLPRVAYDSGKQGGTAPDGNELLKEFDLKTGSVPPDLEVRDDTPFIEVETGKQEINL